MGILDAGPIFAVPTPFAASNDAVGSVVDEAALISLLKMHQAKGVRNIVAGGTTGEFSSLTIAERRRLTELCASNFDGKTVAHVSSSCLQECLDLCSHAKEAGCAAVLLLPPFYFHGATSEGIEAFFLSVLKHCKLPCFLYNFPKHAGNIITPSTYSRLAATYPDTVVGIKDSCSIESAEAFLDAVPALPVYVGNDGEALNVLKKGMSGITGACNPCPELVLALHSAHARGDGEEALLQQARISGWMAILSKMRAMGEVPAVKAALTLRLGGGDGWGEGLWGPMCRAPLETPDLRGADSHEPVREWIRENFPTD